MNGSYVQRPEFTHKWLQDTIFKPLKIRNAGDGAPRGAPGPGDARGDHHAWCCRRFFYADMLVQVASHSPPEHVYAKLPVLGATDLPVRSSFSRAG